MELLKEIQKGRLVARKSGNTVKINLLTTIVGEFETLSKKGKPVTEADLVSLLKKFKDNAQETYNISKDENLIKEIEIIDSYLPRQMTEDELRNVINSFVTESGEVSVGKVMSYLKTNYVGLYDGKKASEIIKEHL